MIKKKAFIREQFSLFKAFKDKGACPHLGTGQYVDADIDNALKDLTASDESALQVAYDDSQSSSSPRPR